MADESQNDKGMADRVGLFDKEFQALQNKYQLRVIAQVVFPGGAVLSVPIQVFPFGPTPVESKAKNEVATDATE